MVHWHTADPPELAKACDDAGCLIAQHILDTEDIVTSLHDAAVRGGYQGDLMGLRTRIAWAVRESADAWDMRRYRMEWTIRRGIQHLLEAHDRAVVILAEAQRLNKLGASPLLRREVENVVADAMRGQLAKEETEARRKRHAR